MKKRVAPLISAVVLSSALLGGCVKISISTDRKNSPIESTVSHIDRATESFENTSVTTSNVSSWVEHERQCIETFWNLIDQNPYDRWLNQALADGRLPEKTIFKTYCDFWKAELQATIANGESLFDDPETFNKWKNGLEQWFESALNALKSEMEVLKYTVPQLEVIIPYCKMIRQKVVDTKYFLFYSERSRTGDWDIPIVVTWVTDLEK